MISSGYILNRLYQALTILAFLILYSGYRMHLPVAVYAETRGQWFHPNRTRLWDCREDIASMGKNDVQAVLRVARTFCMTMSHDATKHYHRSEHTWRWLARGPPTPVTNT
jgi:hypothetical protein